MKAGTLTRWLTLGYVCWLHFLRYANWIDLVGARISGNHNVLAWCRMRISDLDRQIDELSILTLQ